VLVCVESSTARVLAGEGNIFIAAMVGVTVVVTGTYSAPTYLPLSKYGAKQLTPHSRMPT